MPQVDKEQDHSQALVVATPDPDPGAPLQELPHWKAHQKILWAEVLQATGSRKNRFRIRGPFGDEQCSQAVLGSLSTTDVGRRVGLDRAVEEAQSEASESELQEREAREEEKRSRRTSKEKQGGRLYAI